MDNLQTKSILTVALMAAFADGLKDEREREAIRKLAETLGAEASIDLPAWYRDVLLSRPDLAEVVQPLDTQGLRQYAYEMAVGVVNADGSQNAAEAAFLAQLAAALKLPATAAESVAQQASAMAGAAVEQTGRRRLLAWHSAATRRGWHRSWQGECQRRGDGQDHPERIDHQCGARTAARVDRVDGDHPAAVAPRVPHRQGVRLRDGHLHAKDFVATLGVGLTSQYVEQFGRKLLGGLLGGLGGGLGRSLGRQAASSGLSFATTYAIGRVAQRYYAAVARSTRRR